MKKNCYFLILFLLVFSPCTFAQISVTANSNAAQLAQIMSGPGVAISNVALIGGAGAAGSFTCNNCSLGMDSGIVLTTGLVTNIIGPNNSTGSTYNWLLNNGDPDLAAYTSQPVANLYDNCALTFDIVAQTDSIQFKYIFGSEEYPEYVCSQYNDVFAFFISGPGIAGLKNIALIPGTGIPVAINSVNPGVPGIDSFGGRCNGVNQSLAYTQYYVNNGNGTQAPYNANPYYIQYDGFTKTLTAAVGGLIPCQTYHLKLVVDDVGDGTIDSGVFIEANSLSSNLVTFDTVRTTSPGVDSAIRGCVDGIATLKFIKPVSVATTVTYTIGGTAVNGTDYTALSGTVQFAAGDSAKQVVIHPIGGATQTQSVVLYLSNTCSPVPYDSSVIYLTPPQQTVVNNDTSVCQGDSVRLSASGAAGTTFAWSPNTNISATNISNPYVFPAATTTYTCTATLAGCTSTASVVVTVYTTAPFSVNAGPDIVACGGGIVQLDAIVSGNPIPGKPFTYSWQPAAGLTNSTIINPVDTSSSGATYTVFVSSGRCTASDAVVVSVEYVRETMGSTLTSCSYSANGTATATVTSGTAPYGYTWSNGATTSTISNLATGLYKVTVSDQVGCTSSDTITVYAPGAITFGAPVITPVSCPGGNNGTATITATGGTGNITYAWSSGATTSTASNLTASTYTVTATDGNACTANATTTVGTLPPVVVNTSTTTVSCFGGSDGTATATVTGGTSPYTYLWSTGGTTATITGLMTGSYPVTVTDNATCTASANSNVAQQPLLTSTEVATNVLCFGSSSGSIIISPSGGTTSYSYLWQDGNTQQNRSNIPTGTYTLIITDAKGCTTYDTAVLTQPTALILADSIVNATCYGTANGAVYLTVTGGTPPYSYDWGIGIFSQNATNIPADSYYPTVTDNQGCLATAIATVTSPAKIQLVSAVTNVTCFGKSDGIAQIYPSGGVGGFTYTWNGVSAGNPDSGLAAGTYAVIATDTNNCTAVATVIVSQPTALTLTINGKDALCFNRPDGQAVDMPAGGTSPYSYFWSNGQTAKTATGLVASSYQSTVTDNFGCTASSGVIISQPGQILFTVDSTAVKCIGSKDGTITVHVSSGGIPPYNYAVTKDFANFEYPTGATISGLDTGKYIVMIADSNGCEVGSTSFVPNAIPDSFNITTDSTSCFGAQYTDGAIHVTGLVSQNTPYQYKVDNSPFQFSGNFYNLAAGNHTIEVSNYNQCLTDTSATIGEPVQGFAQVLPKDTTMPLGEKIQLFSSFTNYPASAIVSYNWVPSAGLSCVDCPNPVVSSYSHINNYKLTITYNNGCIASDSARIIVIGTPQVFVPNSFSPNGDGNNDLFLIYGENIKTVNLKVFNRWGELVFNSENQFLGWDGNYKGQAQQTGVYVYEAQITFLDNTQTLRTGSITLIR